MKRIICIGITSLFILSLTGFSWAAQENATPVKENKAVDVGNKICPVSGEKINEKFKATYEYEGKAYNFCCTMCIEEFRKNPKKYIEKVEEELQAESKQESGHEEQTTQTMQGSETMPEVMHEGHQH